MRGDSDRGLMAVRLASTSGNQSDWDNDSVLDFRACQDDAWYAVCLSLLQIKREGEGKGDGDTILNVAYTDLEGGDFPDERFSASQFSSLEDLVVFASRFRPTSTQLQDDQCSNLTRGMLVSACHPFEPDQLLFYDALVESVEYKEHRFHAETGEEECCCTFLLLWQHGPLQGTLSHRRVADICLLKPASQFPPALASFLSTARRHLQQCHPYCDRVLRRLLPDLVSVSPGPADSKPSIVPFKEPVPGHHTYPTIWNPRHVSLLCSISTPILYIFASILLPTFTLPKKPVRLLAVGRGERSNNFDLRKGVRNFLSMADFDVWVHFDDDRNVSV
ncbi:SAWADEE domain [Dillenia turbinata]|uniref:SAWADEE domain n=1 Tax=Dillenia turbinata TaxID=194707 RepID=A0AAN8UWB2_9MAGN